MFGDLRFASFLKGTHKSNLRFAIFDWRLSIQARDALGFNLLLNICAEHWLQKLDMLFWFYFTEDR
jgi:hypothetical protein